METDGNRFDKFFKRFYCENCRIDCRFNSIFQRHILSRKHASQCAMETDGNGWKPNLTNFSNVQKLSCEKCQKVFKNRSGLWKHSQKCICDEEPPQHSQSLVEKTKNITDKDELILFLIKENSEFKSMVVEQQNMMMKVLENGTYNHNSHNITNKTFNLQVFLNETCKDAMNISDFVNSIKLQLSDLEKFGEMGYVDGISSIIANNLKSMDVTQRPVHCTDKKREIIYVKDENQWEKDDNKTKLRRMIKHVANKNIKLLPQFRAKYPEYSNASSIVSDKYDKMVVEVMGGLGNNDLLKEDKIINNISKFVVIDKSCG
jgi:hypothetical protein